MMNRALRLAVASALITAGALPAGSVIVPETPKLVGFAKPAIIKPAEHWKQHEAMLTLGLLSRKAQSILATTWIGNTEDTSTATVYTFTSASIGTASSDRHVIVGVVRPGSGAATVSSMTIGGVSATIDLTVGANLSGAGFGRLLVTSGTTATIVVTMSASAASCGILVWTIKGAPSLTVSDTDQTQVINTNMVIDLKQYGATLGLVAGRSGSTALTTALSRDLAQTTFTASSGTYGAGHVDRGVSADSLNASAAISQVNGDRCNALLITYIP